MTQTSLQGKREFDVAVVGAGAAGVTAASALARKGYSVIVLEKGEYPGSENWSGTVYFTENLVAEEAFGPDILEDAPIERNLVKRGFFLYDGVSMAGGEYRNDSTFRNCHTVLRPIFDRYLAEKAKEFGVTFLCETTVQSLIRKEDSVVGCHTDRGPVYASCVFLAEGDASHLTTQEGYEQLTEEQKQEDAPHFLQGIKEVIDFPPAVLEERFNLSGEEGAAYEILLRNGNLQQSTARLNAGGFLYTNRDSVSIGMVLPVDNLAENPVGDHNHLMEWFKGLPKIQALLEGGEMRSFGTKIIRGGGYHEIPQMVDDGLAIGGAATGIGLDFPYPNFTGPATYMGLEFARAFDAVHSSGSTPTREELQETYEDSVKDSHYFQNVEYLADFPDYVERTRFFFEKQIDVFVGSGYFLSRTDRGLIGKLNGWNRYMRSVLSGGDWKRMLSESSELSRIFGISSHLLGSIGITTIISFLVNTIWSLLPVSQTISRDEGDLRLFFDAHAIDSDEIRPPALFRWYTHRFRSSIKKALNAIYTNDRTPIEAKLSEAVREMVQSLSPWDLVLALVCLPILAIHHLLLLAKDTLKYRVLGASPEAYLQSDAQQYLRKRREAGKLDQEAIEEEHSKDQKLSTISYSNTEDSFIRVFFPEEIQDRKELEKSPLWHVCPARVYEVYAQYLGNPGVTVNFENCIKCETCWRSSDDVHWSVATDHRLIFETYSSSQNDFDRYLRQRSLPEPDIPERDDQFQQLAERQQTVIESVLEEVSPEKSEKARDLLANVQSDFRDLKRRVQLFLQAVDEQPSVLEKGRRHWLAAISDSILDQAEELDVKLKGRTFLPIRKELDTACDYHLYNRWDRVYEQIRELGEQERSKRSFWASETGRRLMDVHFPQIGNVLFPLDVGSPQEEVAWTSVEDSEEQARLRQEIRTALEDVFDHHAVKSLEEGATLTPEQRSVLSDCLSRLALMEDRAEQRSGILVEECAKIDPSLAWLVIQHLWGIRILQSLDSEKAKLTFSWRKYYSGDRWLTVATHTTGEADLEIRKTEGEKGEVDGEATFVPLQLADEILVFDGREAVLLDREEVNGEETPLNPCGLIGSDLHQVVFSGEEGIHLKREQDQVETDGPFVSGESLVELTDLYARMCEGASSYLLRRSRDHARSRVQFPGQFQDEAGMDTIGKFGSVKQMISEMETGRYLLETIGRASDEQIMSDRSVFAACVRHVIGGWVFGPENGGCGYNAGQVFGGTAYSEDDLISKYYRDSSVARFLGSHPDKSKQSLALFALTASDDMESFSERLMGVDTLDYWREDPVYERNLSGFTEASNRIEELLADVREELNVAERDSSDLVRKHGSILRQLGMVIAWYIGTRTAIVRTLTALKEGRNREEEIQFCAHASHQLLQRLDRLEQQWTLHGTTRELGKRLLAEGAFEPVPDQNDFPDYQKFLDSDQTFETGSFLWRAYDDTHNRYLPEMRSSDPIIGPEEASLEETVIDRFYEDLDAYPEGSFEGLSYGRYLEKIHTFPDDSLDFLRNEGLLRFPISESHGGEGHWKSSYLMMTNILMRYGDPSMALVVMANTSIGTTPIQLGLHEDLPKARRELEEVQEDDQYFAEIRDRVDEVLRQIDDGNQEEVKNAFDECDQLVKERLRNTSALKYLSGAFIRTFYEAGKAGKNREFQAFHEGMEEARGKLSDIEEGISEKLAEYSRREEAHHFFLKAISAGEVSAFALTEPTAGSDSGGIKTTAKLHKREVFEDPETGLDYFLLGQGDDVSRRYILDPRDISFDFEEGSWFYQHEQASEPVEVKFDEYDYQHDSPEGKKRYLDLEDEKQYFHDVGRIREDQEGTRYYEFYRLNGAKMWITNGRMAGVFCLYAQTEEGVTGFMVDRHAEGLVVGADEEKMGQRGSPTNEISLKDVRVSRENVIGFKGRGQVNALETLNAGRTGLSYCVVGQMKDIIDRGAHYIEHQPDDFSLSDNQYHLLGEIGEYIMGSESLSHEVVGYLDHPKTRGVRMESAIGKFTASENFHHAITCGERLRGIEGQTGNHEIEKKRRDARVINIYEGTNEVQRFLILRDLLGRIYAKLDDLESISEDQTAYPEMLELFDRGREQLRSFLQKAGDRFGNHAWQQVSFQPIFFPLTEMAGSLKQMDSVLHRLDRIREAVSEVEEHAYYSLVEKAGKQFIRKEFTRLRERARAFERRYAYLQDNRYPPSVQIGFLSLNREEEGQEEEQKRLRSRSVNLSESIRIAVCVKPVPYDAPTPRLQDGEIVESHYRMNPADRAALEEALMLREKAETREQIQIDVYSVGAEEDEHVQSTLQQAMALGADRAFHVVTPADETIVSQYVAESLKQAMEKQQHDPDLILLGERADDTGQGTTGPLLASYLDRGYCGEVSTVTELTGTAGSLRWTLSSEKWKDLNYEGKGPVVLALRERPSERIFSVQQYVDARSKNIECISVSGAGYAVQMKHRLRTGQAGEQDGEKATTPDTAADHFLETTDVQAGSSSSASGRYAGDIQPFDTDQLSLDPYGLFITPPVLDDSESMKDRVQSACNTARDVALHQQKQLGVVVPTSLEEEEIREGFSSLLEALPGDVILVHHSKLKRFSRQGYRQLIQQFQEQLDGDPSFWMGTPEYREAFSQVFPDIASQMESAGNASMLWHATESVSKHNGYLEFTTSVFDGKAESVLQVPGRTSFISTLKENITGLNTDDEEEADSTGDVYSFSPDLSYDPERDSFAELLGQVRDQEGEATLEEAEYIIDVGYGVGNMEGMKELTNPLQALLEEQLGLDGVRIGATRKVTQDLELLPHQHQIGQTGVEVHPEVILALGVSGAPQHIDYIGEEATIYCFNIDPDAPLMNLNEERTAPVVHPIEGDMFETVPAFIERVRDHLEQA